jgi:hypothetical protein
MKTSNLADPINPSVKIPQLLIHDFIYLFTYLSYLFTTFLLETPHTCATCRNVFDITFLSKPLQWYSVGIFNTQVQFLFIRCLYDVIF